MHNGVAVTLSLVLMSSGLPARAVNVEYHDDVYSFTQNERAVIQLIADATEKEVRAHLSGLAEPLVLIVRTGKYVIEQTGETGTALSAGTVQWTVDHQRPEGVVTIARNQLRHTLFHEFHHLVRGWLIDGGDSTLKSSFMGAVISEGMATVFARDFAGAKVPWAEYPNEVSHWAGELQRLPTRGYRYDHWMIRHPDGRQWIGYRTGTYLVDLAIEPRNFFRKNIIPMSQTAFPANLTCVDSTRFSDVQKAHQ